MRLFVRLPGIVVSVVALFKSDMHFIPAIAKLSRFIVRIVVCRLVLGLFRDDRLFFLPYAVAPSLVGAKTHCKVWCQV